MKSKRFLVLVIVAFVCIFYFTNCMVQPSSKGQLTLIISNKINAKILTPSISMDVDSYIVSGIGPDSNTFSGSTTNSSFSVIDLQIGIWEVTVDAYNSDGEKIGSGSDIVQITIDPSIMTIEVTPISGYGTLGITVIWQNDILSEPGISATLGKIGQTPTGIDFLISDNRATYVNNEIENGYYTFSVNVLDGGIAKAGAVDVIRIVSGQNTSGQFEFQDFNEIGGALTISAVNNLYPPLDVQLSAFELTQPAGTVQELSATVTNCSSQVVFEWYVNGKYKNTGVMYEFGQDLPPGPFRIDVVAYTLDGTRAGNNSGSISIIREDNISFSYETDFSSDPEWDTNNLERYFWDQGLGVYSTENYTNSGDWALKSVIYNGGSFQFSVDIKPIERDTGDVCFGLFDDNKNSNSTVGEKVYILLGGCSPVVYLYSMTATGINCVSTEGGMVFNEWHNISVNFNSADNNLSIEVFRNSSNVFSWSGQASGGFSSNLKYLGVSMAGSWVTSGRYEKALIDNVSFINYD